MMAMSESCAKALKLLKELLTNPDSYEPYCIGTSRMFWKKIETEGLTPVVCSSSGVCADTTYSDVDGRNLNRIWIGRKGHRLCNTYAKRAVRKSAGDPLNITFNAQLSPSGMRPSKEYTDAPIFVPSQIDFSDIPKAPMLLDDAKRVCSQVEIDEFLQSLPDWTKSLLTQKSANFASLINVNPISIENARGQDILEV